MESEMSDILGGESVVGINGDSTDGSPQEMTGPALIAHGSPHQRSDHGGRDIPIPHHE